MAKPHRMALLTGAALGLNLLQAALWALLFGTALYRSYRLVKTLSHRP